MSNIRTQRYQLIDISLAADFSASTINIPDQPMLRHMRVQALEIFFVPEVGNSPITGNEVMNSAQAAQAAINLYTADPISENDTGEFVYRLPLSRLHNIVNSAADQYQNIPYYLDDIAVQWEKCSITFTNWTPVHTPVSILIGVYYTSKKERNVMITGKKIAGVESGTILEMLMSKIMQLEDKLKSMTQHLLSVK